MTKVYSSYSKTQEHPLSFLGGHGGDGILRGTFNVKKHAWTLILVILGEH